MVEGIFWLGHDSFRLKGEKTVYIDPRHIAPSAEKADVILVTHEHHDHFSKDDIARISKADTVVVGPPSVTKQLTGKTITVQPCENRLIEGVPIETVAAYNVDKKFHPKSAGHVGYIVTLNGKRIYHAGDSDLTPEMAGVKTDIALLPVSGKYVMDPAEAAEAANALKPGLAIPMHYGDPEVVGTIRDAQEFKRLAKVPVEILEKIQ
jgi:L-ascorbate metabolism protein UlaG (beta-lactamase superfamily)